MQSAVTELLRLKAALAAAQEAGRNGNGNGCTEAASSGNTPDASTAVGASSGVEIAAGAAVSVKVPDIAPHHPYLSKAVWQLGAQALFFSAERSAAKELAKALVPALSSLAWRD